MPLSQSFLRQQSNGRSCLLGTGKGDETESSVLVLEIDHQTNKVNSTSFRTKIADPVLVAVRQQFPDKHLGEFWGALQLQMIGGPK